MFMLFDYIRYLLCKFDRKEVAADQANNRDTGVFPLYPEYDWGRIAVWAWTHGIVVDALDRLAYADMKRIMAKREDFLKVPSGQFIDIRVMND